MSYLDGIEWIFFCLVLAGAIPLLGKYMYDIFQGRPVKILSNLESIIYKTCSINPEEETSWKEYLNALLIFNGFGLLFLFLLQAVQGLLPFNPQGFSGIPPLLAFNTAISFVTNTNWQAYAGESTMSYLTQSLGLAVQNFLSAATGSAVLIALIRGIVRSSSNVIGNFWVDTTRTIVYLLLPLSICFAFLFIYQGSIQNFNPYQKVQTVEGVEQTIPMGPVASQVAIKQLGSNGGGFFSANGAHPFENPTPLTNFLQNLAILLIPAAAAYMYGMMIGSKKQGYVILYVMVFLWLVGIALSFYSESILNPVLNSSEIMEGKETRFGLMNTLFWSVSTTATSNGSVNGNLSSLSPIAGGVLMINMVIGEVIFGGVGVGLCGMLMFVLLTVFLAGLMVGRTPEYLGKKIEKLEVQWVMLAILTPCALTLLGSGIACILPAALSSVSSTGPHGLSEILYAFTSAAGNNGSAFAGLDANTPFYNISLGLIMLLSRLAILVPSLAIAGSMANKRTLAPSSGTFSTDTALFGFLLACIILIVAALTFFPALSLGPILEHLLMNQARAF